MENRSQSCLSRGWEPTLGRENVGLGLCLGGWRSLAHFRLQALVSAWTSREKEESLLEGCNQTTLKTEAQGWGLVLRKWGQAKPSMASHLSYNRLRIWDSHTFLRSILIPKE